MTRYSPDHATQILVQDTLATWPEGGSIQWHEEAGREAAQVVAHSAGINKGAAERAVFNGSLHPVTAAEYAPSLFLEDVQGAAPERLLKYIDLGAYARDLLSAGKLVEVEYAGRVHTVEPCAVEMTA